ncbi:MAG: signal transduction histidine kinase [Enterobacterales bacterium]|jgi:signal transduction histidine kinase
MRTLAAILYLVIIGCLVLGTYFVECIGSDIYKDEVSHEYLRYANILSPLIEKDLQSNPDNIASTLKRWSSSLDEELITIELIARQKTAHNDQKIYVSNVEVTDQTDTIRIIAPLSYPGLDDKSLLYLFTNSYSDDYINFYNRGSFAVYLFMALVITIIAWLVYRYINSISRTVHSVALGNSDFMMPPSHIPALQRLSSDINSMVITIEDKKTENLILTGAIHHELRIPITRIRLALDMAMHGKNDEMTNELLTDMDTDLEELSDLMETLLTISRLRLKGLEIDKEPVNLQHILGKVIQDINSPFISIEKIEEFVLEANQTLLERAMNNIINNAVKYAENKVVISSRSDNNQFVLTVEDDGPGIPVNERALILKPFYRTDKSRTRTTGGFGLGLAIADMVIRNTHGSIAIDDSELGGAKISLIWLVE